MEEMKEMKMEMAMNRRMVVMAAEMMEETKAENLKNNFLLKG